MNASDFNSLNDHASGYKENFTPDTERALARMHARIAVSSSPSSATFRTIYVKRLLAAAAAILLLLTAGYLVFSGDGSAEFLNDTNAPMAFDLPDGTGVLLQQGSVLHYKGDYNVADRHIFLAGQAFFEVAKDKNRPFLVNTAETELRVTGTAFNLRVQNGELEVEVSEGAVELHRNGEVLAVSAMQCGLALPGKKCTLMEAKQLNRHAWRTGVLTFQGTPLGEALKTIRNNYGLEVVVPMGCDFPVSGNFSGQDPVAILQTIAAMDGGQLLETGEGNYRLLEMDCGR